jgi:hypothetical protein
MTDTPPVAAAEPLPAFLLNSNLANVESDYVVDATGAAVEPSRFTCSRIRGFDMKKLPLPHLRTFCLSMGILVPENATQSSLLEALARKKQDTVATRGPPLTFSSSDEDDGVDEATDPPNQSNGTPAQQLTKEQIINSATLDDVVIIPEKDDAGNDVEDENGIKVMVATAIKGIAIKNILCTLLRKFSDKVGVKGRNRSKLVISRQLAYAKQMDSAHELTGAAAKQSSNQRLSMKLRLLNTCFTDDHYDEFVNVNKRKTRNQIDRGDAGNSQHFYAKISAVANDSLNNDVVGRSCFPDDEHLSEAITEGLDLNSFVVITWTQAKKLLGEVFKEHQLAREKFTKSGSHEKNFFGDGFTKDLAAYYFYLLLQDKPEAHKSVSTMLDEGVFHVAGAPAGDGDLKRPAAGLEKKKNKAARQSEANFKGAKDVMEPLMESFVKTQSDREDRRENKRESRDAYEAYVKMGAAIDSKVIELSKAVPGSVVYKHLEERIEESQEDKLQLRIKSGMFER